MTQIVYFVFFSLISIANPERSQNVQFWVNQLGNSSIDLRINALQKLSEIKNHASVGAISRVLNSSNAELRYQAARTLAKIPTESSLQVLADRIREEKDVYVKSEISRSIRTLKDYFEKIAEKEKPEPEDSSEETAKE